MKSKTEKTATATAAAATGAAAGYGAVAATGMFGGGPEFGGAAAGPVGAAMGALAGLVGYGLYKLWGDD